jgi:hypothetical protein
MARITLAVIVVILVTACESNEETGVRYQTAYGQCTRIAAKTALAEPGLYGPKHEAIAAAALNGCLSAHGFKKKVELAMEQPNAR